MSFELIFTGIILLTALCYVIMILAFTAAVIRPGGKRKKDRQVSTYFSAVAKDSREPVLPQVSVILPVRNESGNIASCLDTLANQDYNPAFFEIIVSDDFSEDYTADKVRKWAKDHPSARLVLLEGGSNSRENQGKKKAIERAVAAARGDILLTTDADTFRSPSWIRTMAGAFVDKSISMVLGPVGFTGEKGMFQKMQVLEFLGIMGVTAGSSKLEFPLMCNGANLAYRKECFIAVGGFSGNSGFHSGDDQFLMMNVAGHFGKGSVMFLQDKDAIVLTSPCVTWNDFWEQRIRWVSKSRGYRNGPVIAAGLITAGFPFLILLGGIAGIFYPEILLLSSFLWFVKILSEYPLVWLMAGFFGKKHLLNYYFAAQAFQFFYSITTAVAGQFISYSWKGRHLRK